MIKLNVTSRENENDYSVLISGAIDASEKEIISMMADLVRTVSRPIDDTPTDLLAKLALLISLQDLGIRKEGDNEK